MNRDSADYQTLIRHTAHRAEGRRGAGRPIEPGAAPAFSRRASRSRGGGAGKFHPTLGPFLNRHLIRFIAK